MILSTVRSALYILIAITIISPCFAAELSFDDFMKSKYVTKETGLGASKEALVAKNAIRDLFSSFGQVSEKNKTQLFQKVDDLVDNKTLLGRQAQAIKRFITEKIKDKGAPILLPVVAKVPDISDWIEQTARLVDVYFSRPYQDKPTSLPCPPGEKLAAVQRPNHSLAHGLRQGFLALDIIDGLNASSALTNPNAVAIAQWVKRKIATDPYFRQKVFMASAFQRTGRQSEASSSGSGKTKYDAYERQDAANFSKDAAQLTGPQKAFANDREAQVFKEAILWSTAAEGKIDPNTNEDLKFLRKILHSAHDFDLRRLFFDSAKGGPGSSFQKMTSAELFGPDSYNEPEKTFINKIWSRSGEYLRSTGDRDRDPEFIKQHDKYNAKLFCELAADAIKMAKTLIQMRKTSKVSL